MTPLQLQIREVEKKDGDNDALLDALYAQRRKERKPAPAPTCCAKAQEFQHAASQLTLVRFFASPCIEEPPSWCAGFLEGVSFCPFCGQKLPEMRIKSPKPEVSTSTDGGYYCDVCSERLHACLCDAPGSAYEPVPR